MNLLRSWLLVFVQALNLWLPFVLGSLFQRISVPGGPLSEKPSGLPPYSWDHTGLEGAEE